MQCMPAILANAQKLESRIKLIENKYKLSYLHCKDIWSFVSIVFIFFAKLYQLDLYGLNYFRLWLNYSKFKTPASQICRS